MIRIAVAGAGGRMGRTLLSLAARDKDLEIVGAIENADSPVLGSDIGELIGSDPTGVRVSSDAVAVMKRARAVIDFSHASATAQLIKAASKTKTSYVLGTTGLSQATQKLIRTASRRISIVQAPNMSIGVNVLFKLADIVGKALDESYDIEISEIHHRGKKDAPSGTAVKLLEILAEARKRNPARDAIYGRKGETGKRPVGKIGVFALRGGDVVGDHTVSFLGDGERVELVHRASSREAFAQGALRAAKFLAKRRAGLYDMQQVLGIA